MWQFTQATECFGEHWNTVNKTKYFSFDLCLLEGSEWESVCHKESVRLPAPKVQEHAVSFPQHMALICENTGLHPFLRKAWRAEEQNIVCVLHVFLQVCLCSRKKKKTCFHAAQWEGLWPALSQMLSARVCTSPPTSALTCTGTSQCALPCPHVSVCQSESTFHTCEAQWRELELLSCFAKLRRAATHWLFEKGQCSLHAWRGWQHSWALKPGAQGFTWQCWVNCSSQRPCTALCLATSTAVFLQLRKPNPFLFAS